MNGFQLANNINQSINQLINHKTKEFDFVCQNKSFKIYLFSKEIKP